MPVDEKPEQARSLQGIWLAIRKTPHMNDVPCSQCYRKVRDHEVYNERMWGSPIVVCGTCVENMVESRLALIGKGG